MPGIRPSVLCQETVERVGTTDSLGGVGVCWWQKCYYSDYREVFQPLLESDMRDGSEIRVSLILKLKSGVLSFKGGDLQSISFDRVNMLI